MQGLDKVNLLIPAAGFGQRVGAPMAKEMLLDDKGLPLIAYSLNLAEKYELNITVILRPEKHNLISYLKTSTYFQEFGKIIEVQKTQEWPESLLLSKPHWVKKNLVLLPDTRWGPEDILPQMISALDESDICVANHLVQSTATWGRIEAIDKHLCIKEKIIDEDCAQSGPQKAWGLIGFKKNTGQKLFEAQLKSTLERVPVRLKNTSSKFLDLLYFRDITR